MLTLPLYPAHFVGMVAFLSRISQQQLEVPLDRQPLSICVLLEFQAKLKLDKIFAWGQRDPRRAYKYRMSPVVARALHEELQHYTITPYQRELLAHIDKAIVDYQVPLALRHTINSLPAYA